MRSKTLNKTIASWLVLVLAFGPSTISAAPGDVITTPSTPMELPVEVEIELSPAGSLKQALLWKELYQLLKNPGSVTCPDDDPLTPLRNESDYCTADIERRPRFGAPDAVMPAVNVYSLGYNFLTGQPMRLRTSDGEVSWDQPGPLFDTGESCLVPGSLDCEALFNTPTELRTVIGHLVACPNEPTYQAAALPPNFCAGIEDGSLVIHNPDANTSIPADGTVIAVAAFVDGVLHELEGGELEPVDELEAPVNEEDFFRDPADTANVPVPLASHVGRLGAEVLGKALFWDMQVGSDGVQSCGSCHFSGGVDNRVRNQLNPGHLAGDFNLDVRPPNTAVNRADFPFRRLQDPNRASEGDPRQRVLRDQNDVMSSMGVRFREFEDIPPIGSFGPAVNGVSPLLPDVGTDDVPDPIAAAFIDRDTGENLRRVEPRNTPTMHGAAFNLDNFWDGRARFNFNGGSVFGPSDPTAHIFIDTGAALEGATMGHLRPELLEPDEEEFDEELAEQPVRIKFSSLGSQAVGPPLSDFEMSFSGRNWQKIGKKLLQAGVTPLANQLVAVDDSRLGPFSNQGGSLCPAGSTAAGKPGLCITYPQLIELAFRPEYWTRTEQHLDGAACGDPFDGYCLEIADGPAAPTDTSQFTQMEANFSLFFGLAAQAYEALLIPDDTPADRFFDANPNAGHAVGEPGDQAVLFPTLIPDLLDDGLLNGTNQGTVTLIPDDPATPWYDGFGPDEVFGFDIFAGSNLTAALPSGTPRNPRRTITTEGGDRIQIAVGSNPFTRSAKCMLCHLGPEQTDHSINIAHGLLKNDAEFEYPTPPAVDDPNTPAVFLDGLLPAPEPSGSSRTVAGLILAEEIGEGPPQDAVEVEPRGFAILDDLATPWDDRIISQPSNFAFGDQGVYNIGLRPNSEDIGRGGDDPFEWPLSLSALTLMNIGGETFEPNDNPLETSVMADFDPNDLGSTFEETGALQSINPGFERGPIEPALPPYLAPWVNDLPAGELHPQIDEMAGMVPNTLTPPNGGPAIEFPEVLFGADLHCAAYDPAIFGMGPPNWGWGSALQLEMAEPGPSRCPNNQSGVAGNHDYPVHGTWPVPNRVLRDGAFKAPPLRNVELTGPYFHTGSFLTLRQVVDFYFRGGDFPITNAESRDPHVVNLNDHAFAFGRSTGDDIRQPINFAGIINAPQHGYLVSDVGFADGLPDNVFLYDVYPDSNHPFTPEPVFASRAAAIEDAKSAIVKFLLALTDPRVKLEKAPFDRPEIFVPIDGRAPDNTVGRNGLVTLSSQTCAGVPTTEPNELCFRHVPAVGAGGSATPVPNFLGIASVPTPGQRNDHFDP